MTGHPALLATDLVGSTELAARLGDAATSALWESHDRIARDLLRVWHGREIDRTDGFLLLFVSVEDAVGYALAYHRALAGLRVPLRARAGVHVGPVTIRENRSDDIALGAKPIEYDGIAVPMAVRTMSVASGGQTLLTAAARSQLRGEVRSIRSHGHWRMKGLEEPVELFEVGDDRAPFAPPPDSEKVYRVVRAGDLWRPVRDVRHNLPAERDAFIGRSLELSAFAARLEAGTRLLTVLGPGGTGKTRFVRRYGWTWLGDWPGGIYFVDLSEARSPHGIFFAVASALDLRLGKEPDTQLGHAIASRGRCLVILDNFEQLVEHAATTLGRWLDAAAAAVFVVTSRERLHLHGEEVFPLEPLPLGKEAVDLFVARARAQVPDFALTDGNRAAVGEVVGLLDGLPLAIELAAARVRVLSPAQLLERMRDRFAILAGARGAARQATLRAAIDWSWDLLAHWEQAALAQCSVFDGGFTLEAAEAVLDLSPWPHAPPAVGAVQALVDKSLLRTWLPTEGDRYDLGEPYFGMYLSIHEYAAEKLAATGPASTRATQERHGAYFASLGTDEAIEALYRHAGVRRLHALALEIDNLVAACRRAIERHHGAVTVACYRAAWEVLERNGPYALGDVLGAQVLALDGLDAGLMVSARLTRALVSRRTGRMAEAEEGLAQALALARAMHDRRREGVILGHLGILLREQGRMREALARYDEALGIHREVGNRVAEGVVHGNLGNLHGEQSRMDEARSHYVEALAIHRDVGNRSAEGLVLGNMGLLYSEQGAMEEAQAYYQQALAIHREVGNRHEAGIVLGNLGLLHYGLHRFEEARAHYEAALSIAREVGDRRHEGFVLGALGNLDMDCGRMSEAQAHFEQALAIHRAVGNRRSQGAILGSLGKFLIKQGRPDDARAVLCAGEAMLREVGDRLELGYLLCIQGQEEASANNLDLARAKLAEAESIAALMGAGPDSELCQKIVTLRQAVRI